MSKTKKAEPVETAGAETPAPDAAAAHDAWCETQRANGWQYGPVFCPTRKYEPRLVPFDQLPTPE